MRRLVSLVLVIVVVLPALPASAKPSATDIVTWTVDGGTVTLDTATNTVTVDIEGEVWVECGGANALATADLSGTASVEVTLDRHGRSGSFNGDTIDLQPTVTFGGCGDYEGSTLTSSIAGEFETFKGKADRWRDGSDRVIERQGTGTISVDSLVDVQSDVTATRTISK